MMHLNLSLLIGRLNSSDLTASPAIVHTIARDPNAVRFVSLSALDRGKEKHNKLNRNGKKILGIIIGLKRQIPLTL